MAATAGRTYADAEAAIWTTISSGAALDAAAMRRGRVIQLMQGYARRVGLESAVSEIPVVHIAGTKGKGSTACMVESMLRQSGLKTGMFTSPHLVTFRERFRLNGRPITEDRFLDHFWRIWDRLHSTESSPADTDAPKIPGFFHLLTLLAFAISSEEAVDVLVLEVGLGGRLDATNVVMNPVVCGVTRLDYDHVEVLGGTIAAIAREKAGIFKTGSPVWTIEQEAPAAKVLSEVAETVHAPLRVTGPSDIASRVTASPGPAEGGAAASETDPFPTLGLDGAFQRVNAALAVALTETFLVRTGRLPLSETRVPSCMGTQWPERVVAAAEPATEAASAALSGALLAGLEQATWPGRAHSLVAELVKSASGDDGAASGTRWQLQRAEAGETGALGALNVYLDGAHTSASMQQAAQWFTVASARAAVGAAPEDAAGGSAVRRVLVFGCSHTKDVVQLLLPLTSLRWDRVIFCPLLASRPSRHGTPDVEGLLECFWQRKAEAEAGTPAEADTPAAPPRAAGEDTPSDGGTVSRPEPTAAGAHSAAPVKPSAAASSTWCSTLAELWTRVGTDAALAAEREAVAPAGAGAGSGSEAEAVVAATAAASVEEALRVALPETQSTTAVFVTGSLYLVGDCLTAVGWNPDERGL